MRRWGALLLLSLLLSGCALKLAYNNLELISPWYVDDYIDFDAQQKQVFDHYLQELHQWHRQTELPQYRQLFAELHQQLQQPELDKTALKVGLQRLRGHWNALIRQATPAIIELSRNLTDAQIKGLFQALETRNQRRLKRADTADEHRLHSIEQIEKWMGPLNQIQQQWVEVFAAENPDLTLATVAAHRAFQTELAGVLAQRSTANGSRQLTDLLANALSGSAEGRQLTALREQQLEARVELFVKLWRVASDNQKRKVRSRLQGYIDDLEDLIKG